ncbi:Kelch repeat-containing protein [Rheinheimera sp. WS51]|uniref:Kelch repeat-containing protein n=1 Tax=Rheinheimera sp. WS51 TaxID=3425886 RepID=UPI003D922D50
MLLKSIRYLSVTLAIIGSSVCLAQTIPDLPEPVTGNAVASTTIRGKTYIVSMLGLAPGKQYNDLHNQVWMHILGDFNWQQLPPVPSTTKLNGRVAASAVALNNNFFIFGGYTVKADGSKETAPDSYRLDPITKRYTKLNDIPVPVDSSVALAYQNRYIYIVNGWSNYGSVNLVQVFDNFTQRWSQATPLPGQGLFGLSAAIIDNKMLVCDGQTLAYSADKARQYTPSTACYLGTIAHDANNIDWRIIPHPTGDARYRMAAIATTVGNEKVFAFIGGSTSGHDYAGVSFNQTPAEPSNKVWLYSVHKQKWLNAENSTAIMDLNGLIDINGSIYSVGGMQAEQQVSNKLIKHPIKLR